MNNEITAPGPGVLWRTYVCVFRSLTIETAVPFSGFRRLVQKTMRCTPRKTALFCPLCYSQAALQLLLLCSNWSVSRQHFQRLPRQPSNKKNSNRWTPQASSVSCCLGWCYGRLMGSIFENSGVEALAKLCILEPTM